MIQSTRGPRLKQVMDEVDKMAEEGLISAEAKAKIEANLEQAKQAGLFSSAASLISPRQFGRLARGKLDEVQATALYSALVSSKHKKLLATPAAAADAINIANVKGKDPGLFASHLDSLMAGGPKSTTALTAATAFGLPAAAIVAGAAYDAAQTRNNFGAMMEENPDLYDVPEENVRRSYRTLATYAPSMTADPHVAGSTVKKLIEFEAVDPATVRTFQDSQKQDQRVIPRLLQVFQQAAGPAAKAVAEGASGIAV